MKTGIPSSLKVLRLSTRSNPLRLHWNFVILFSHSKFDDYGTIFEEKIRSYSARVLPVPLFSKLSESLESFPGLSSVLAYKQFLVRFTNRANFRKLECSHSNFDISKGTSFTRELRVNSSQTCWRYFFFDISRQKIIPKIFFSLASFIRHAGDFRDWLLDISLHFIAEKAARDSIPEYGLEWLAVVFCWEYRPEIPSESIFFDFQ